MPPLIFFRRKDTTKIRKLFIFIFIIPATFFTVSCASGSIDSYYRSQISSRSQPYAFSYTGYEINKLVEAVQNRSSLADKAGLEDKLKEQIVAVLRDNNIPVVPPLVFSIEDTPHLLVVSPRERILYYDRVVLKQEMSTAQQKYLESTIDDLGLSSLVVGLGGFGGTYPPIIENTDDVKFIVHTAVEEWLHQYLALKPLGFRYLLDSIGIKQDPDVVIMNETAAGIISREIAAEVYSRYYYSNHSFTTSNNDGFDFDAEMRQTRKQVDILLYSGQIGEAEKYMEARRQYFLDNGYYIRKLNQAYFAFYGIYGDSPAAVSPIYGGLEELRAKSGNLKAFLDVVSSFTSYNDLQ
jgi:hypothetical protein